MQLRALIDSGSVPGRGGVFQGILALADYRCCLEGPKARTTAETVVESGVA